jgi:hypothetical protein
MYSDWESCHGLDEVLSRQFPEGTEEVTEHFSIVGVLTDSNRRPPEYKSRTSPLHEPALSESLKN